MFEKKEIEADRRQCWKKSCKSGQEWTSQAHLRQLKAGIERSLPSKLGRPIYLAMSWDRT